jgi:hypothetical protein
MRRVIVAALFVASSVGLYVLPATADSPAKVTLSYDFSANGQPPSASGPNFIIEVDVLPEQTPGLVRVVAVAPDNSGVNNIVCRFQTVDNSHVTCKFNFTAAGTWSIHSQYAADANSDVSAWAVTNIRVGY